MAPYEHFHHCPRCGANVPAGRSTNPFDCDACNLRLYFNPAAAVAVFIKRNDGKVLMIRRAKDPGQGRLAPPGGFIDIGERAEVAVGREIAEELGMRLTDVRFLCSQPNSYLFRDITYPVLDLFFTATADDELINHDPNEVTSADWHRIEDVRAEDLAFPSMQAAWKEFVIDRK